jgi:hypothetical protein
VDAFLFGLPVSLPQERKPEGLGSLSQPQAATVHRALDQPVRPRMLRAGIRP